LLDDVRPVDCLFRRCAMADEDEFDADEFHLVDGEVLHVPLILHDEDRRVDDAVSARDKAFDAMCRRTVDAWKTAPASPTLPGRPEPATARDAQSAWDALQERRANAWRGAP
jgi:hypothetical protein